MVARGYVEREGVVVRMAARSILFFDDDAGSEVFLPRSLIRDWWFTKDQSCRSLELNDLELDDEVTFVIPEWLAKREGLA